ncbi:MAG: fibronectin type III domain-containing protein [Ignavibacteria bacterium]
MKTFLIFSILSVFLFSNNTLHAQVPSAPSHLIATAVSSSQINLHWTDNSHNENNFNIEMNSSNHNDSLFMQVGHVSENITTFNMLHLSANTTYHFRVNAVNHTGVSHYSNIASTTTFHDTSHHSIPNAPSQLVAHATSSSMINLTWHDNSHNEGSFVIEKKGPHDSSFHNAGHVGSNATSFTATGLHQHTTYSFRVYATNKVGSSHYSNIVSATTHSHSAVSSYDFILHTNYPNPFNPVTKIAFEIPVAGMTKLEIYDINGKLISSLIDENKAAGSYGVTFDGSQLSSGIYFYKLESNNFSITKKMFLIK